MDDAFYVMAGCSLAPDGEGKPLRTYLRDAWKFAAGRWSRVADLPYPLAAAASPAPIVDYHQGRTRSLAIGIHMTGLYVGQALGGFGALAAAELSWRATFHWLGFAGVAYSGVLALCLRERRVPEGRERAFLTEITGMGRSLGALFSIGAFVVILFYFAAPSAPGWVIKNWLPTLFAKLDAGTVRTLNRTAI